MGSSIVEETYMRGLKIVSSDLNQSDPKRSYRARNGGVKSLSAIRNENIANRPSVFTGN